MAEPSHFMNAFSVDVEEWFHIRRTEDFLPADRWTGMQARLPIALGHILDLFRKTGNRATFFWLGWCAERYPDWVRRVADDRHEIACHGYGHRAIDRMTREEFRAEIRSTRALLQGLSGQPVAGFRAPSLSLGPTTAWMLEVLAEEGFAYDSSQLVTPLRFNRPLPKAGADDPAPPVSDELLRKLRDTRPWRWETRAGTLLEIPVSVRPGRLNLPFAGGLFFRVAPYWAMAADLPRIFPQNVLP